MTNKILKVNELRELDDEKLIAKLIEIEGDLFQLRNELAMNKKLDKPHFIKALRKEKAQILTIKHQKFLSEVV